MTLQSTRQHGLFCTREVMTIAMLACLGAAMSVVIAQIGAQLRALVGMPGVTQVLAGLHVLWLVLAALLVPRRGAATSAGLLKGSLELLLGSTHGLIVLLVSAIAGLLIDLAMLLCPRRRPIPGLIVGAALGAGSNVILFQLIVRLPTEKFAVSAALFVFTGVAALSGALAGGVLGLALIKPLRHAGVISQTLLDQPS